MAFTPVSGTQVMSDLYSTVLDQLITAVHERQDLLGQTNTTFTAARDFDTRINSDVTNLRTDIADMSYDIAGEPLYYVRNAAGQQYTESTLLDDAGYAGGWLAFSSILNSEELKAVLTQLQDVLLELVLYRQLVSLESPGYQGGGGVQYATAGTGAVETAWDNAKADAVNNGEDWTTNSPFGSPSDDTTLGWAADSGGGVTSAKIVDLRQYDVDLSGFSALVDGQSVQINFVFSNPARLSALTQDIVFDAPGGTMTLFAAGGTSLLTSIATPTFVLHTYNYGVNSAQPADVPFDFVASSLGHAGITPATNELVLNSSTLMSFG